MLTIDSAKYALGLRFDSDLAKALNTTRQTVSRWRSRGKGNVPKARVAELENIILKRKLAAGGQ
ncbi:MAG: hypothetical protein AB7O86_14505 [Porticoccaceae bacterium]